MKGLIIRYYIILGFSVLLVALEQTAMKFNAELLSSLCTDLIAMKMLAKQNLGKKTKILENEKCIGTKC